VFGRHIPKVSARKCAIIACVPLLAALILFTILNWIAGAELAGELAKINQAGESLSLEQLAGPRIPNDRNAAPLLEVAFRLLDLGSKEERAEWTRLSWDYAESPDLFDRVLARNEEALQFVERALKRPECRFEINYSAGHATLLPHLSPLRSISRLLRLRALQKAHNADMAGALADIRLILSLSRTLRREPLLISSLVRFAIISLSTRSLQDVLEKGTPPADAVTDLIAALRGQDLQSNFKLAMIGERATGWQTYRDVASGRISGRELLGIGASRGGFIGHYRFFLSRPLLRHDQTMYLRHLGSFVQHAGKHYYKMKEEANSVEHDFCTKRRWAPLARMVVPALTRANEKVAETIAKLHTSRLALALLRFRSESPKCELPESLSELVPRFIPELPVDPLTGKQYVYRRTLDGAIIIYSLGSNEKDDGGEWDLRNGKDDVAFRLSAKPGPSKTATSPSREPTAGRGRTVYSD